MAQFVSIEKSALELEGPSPEDHRPVDCACHLMSWFVRFESSSKNKTLIPPEFFINNNDLTLKIMQLMKILSHLRSTIFHLKAWNQTKNEIKLITIFCGFNKMYETFIENLNQIYQLKCKFSPREAFSWALRN